MCVVHCILCTALQLCVHAFHGMPALSLQVPLDGMVVYGTAQVSWSHISGEALPVRLHEGKEVPAGSLNLDGLLVVRAMRGFQDSTPARIARLTQQAQASSDYIL